MNGDIVNDLRWAILHDSDPWDITVYERAADEIERLRSKLAQLESETDSARRDLPA